MLSDQKPDPYREVRRKPVRVAHSAYIRLNPLAEKAPGPHGVSVTIKPAQANDLRVEAMDALRAVAVAAREELGLPSVGGWALPLRDGPETLEPWRSIHRDRGRRRTILRRL